MSGHDDSFTITTRGFEVLQLKRPHSGNRISCPGPESYSVGCGSEGVKERMNLKPWSTDPSANQGMLLSFGLWEALKPKQPKSSNLNRNVAKTYLLNSHLGLVSPGKHRFLVLPGSPAETRAHLRLVCHRHTSESVVRWLGGSWAVIMGLCVPE